MNSLGKRTSWVGGHWVSQPRSADPYVPAREEVDSLIEQAEVHPLGTDFLRRGALDAVASLFGVHAFVIEVARERFLET